jgi:hypothetical protein
MDFGSQVSASEYGVRAGRDRSTRRERIDPLLPRVSLLAE